MQLVLKTAIIFHYFSLFTFIYLFIYFPVIDCTLMHTMISGPSCSKNRHESVTAWKSLHGLSNSSRNQKIFFSKKIT